MDQHRLPLLERLRPGHWVAVDCCAAVLMALPNKVVFLRCPTWLGVIVLALAVLPAALRRFWPRTVLTVVVVSVAAATALDKVAYLPLAVGYVICLIPLRVPRRESLWLLGGTLAAVAVGLGIQASGPGPGGAGDAARLAAENGLYIVAAWLAGYAVQQRRSYAANARERAEREVREQLAEARRVSSEERLQIARELHDVVAHTVSLIAVQAGVANYVVKTHPEEAARALASIETTSRGALREMRALLAMLRADGTEEGTGRQDELLPAPGLADLDSLVARSAEAGLLVDLEIRGERTVLPAGIDLAAFRVIQEAITNVVKHAGTDRCRVTVSHQEDVLAVEVTDGGTAKAGQTSGLGHGIVGMRERVGMYGGEFRAAPLPGRGFQISARFPLMETES
ncbi:sensor histidine kinase [Streptacidiphilus carbonis]|uniref:sensor histidine kinase n=1 Tax=Streptacidiphilus carbonis TaxID=105422 RepID=UPI0005A776EA|nr:sensor histidine kinase [Streptacidiphilus carbonis]